MNKPTKIDLNEGYLVNTLWLHCPFCSFTQRSSFKAHGGRVFGGSGDRAIICKNCDRGFYIELDVRQQCCSTNE